MKKKFDLFGLKSYDEKIDNEDKELTLQDQFYSQSVKHIKDKRKSSKRIDIGFTCFCIGWLLVLLVLGICVIFAPTDISANAAEEVETTATYNNYTIEFANAPIHFVIPYHYMTTSSITPHEYFNEFIITREVTTQNVTMTYVDMLYQIVGNDGTIYSEDIVRVGYFAYFYVPNTSTILVNSYKGVALTNNQLTTYSSYTQLGTYGIEGSPINMYRRYRPVLSYDEDTGPFTVNFSSMNNIGLSTLKVRACSLYDFQCYGNIPAVWYDYTLTSSSSATGSNLLYIYDASSTTTTTPTYPIERTDKAIFDDGWNQGYNKGYKEGIDERQQDIYDEGYDEGYDRGKKVGLSEGYNNGVEDANDYSFLSLTTAVVDAPVKIFSSMFDFNVLGFNMTTFLFSIITLCLVLAVVKRLL